MTTRMTHFGDRSVPEDEKAGLVRGIFSSVASRYDVMNDLMSVGIHRLWKDAMVDWLAPRQDDRVLDVAGGTGDIAFRILERAPECDVAVLDLTRDMLEEGQKRAQGKPYADNLQWINGDAMALPFPDNTFSAYTIAFGIRNVTRIDAALSEAFRVLRHGGRIVVLEFSQLPNPSMQRLYDAYSFAVIPKLGKAVAGDEVSYSYLVESIRKFPGQDSFAEMIRAAGFDLVKYRNLSMGIAALHIGWKL